jgi:hypothetical protein
MELALVALSVICLSLFASYTVANVIAMNRSLRLEVQKLTAALIVEGKPVASAVYQAHDPGKSTEDILIERANRRHDWKPNGL